MSSATFFSARVLLCVALTVVSATLSHARPAPLIPMEAVPEDMPQEVRRHVLRLYGPDHSDCISAVIALRDLGPLAAPAAPFLAGILYDEVRHGEASGLAVDALSAIGAPSVEPVLIMLQFGGMYARMRGLKVLRALKDERGIPALVAMVADELGASGQNALDLLREYGDPALNYVVNGLRSENPVTRRNSAYSLAAFPTTNSLALLNAALSDPEQMVRGAALESILNVATRNHSLQVPATPELTASLSNPAPSMRRTAIRIIARSTDDRKEQLICAMAADANPEVQQEVIQTLSAMTGTNVEATLASLVKSSDPAVCSAALNVLSGRGSPTVQPLLFTLLASPIPQVREGAVVRIGAMPATNTVDILLPMARDKDPLVRTRAVYALAGTRDRRVLEVLRSAVKDSDSGVRLESARSLSLYYKGNSEGAGNTSRVLPATPEMPLFAADVRDALIPALSDKAIRVRETALGALSARNLPVLPSGVLFSVLSDPEPHMRRDALKLLLSFDSLAPLDPVRRCLKDPDPGVRAGAILVLGKFRDTESFDQMAAAIAAPGEGEARCAAQVLGGFGEKAIPFLATAMRSADEQVRRAASASLSGMRNPLADEALRLAIREAGERKGSATQTTPEPTPSSKDRSPQLLAGLMRGSSPEECRKLGEQLARHGSPAIPVLLPLLQDTNKSVRLAAASTLSAVGGVAVVAPLAGLLADPDPAVRIAAVGCLAATAQTNAAAGAIRALLADPDAGAREAAACALGRIPDRASSGPLAVSLQDDDWHVRMAAAESLGRIGDPSSTDPLLSSLRDPQWPVRRAAAVALAAYNEPRVIQALKDALAGDLHWAVRQSATASLGAMSAMPSGPSAKTPR